MKSGYRQERDSMGTVQVPTTAYYGAQTQRAVNNFSISPYRIAPPMRNALALIKAAAAGVNCDLGLIEGPVAGAIQQAAEEVRSGKLSDHFPLDVFQTGSGTSWNMNMNEVLARRGTEILGGSPRIHPNDHVNRGQSSNDVIPAAMNIAARQQADVLLAELTQLREALEGKGRRYGNRIKLGRTHLQDAVPMSAGQEFSAWARQVELCGSHLEAVKPRLEELPLGGTAVGTGLNSSPLFAEKTVAGIADVTGIPFRRAANPFAHIAARDEQVALMGALNECAVVLMKIAQDLRLLSSGPRAGLGELILPELQPGSSIMPGKINPVIPEMMIQAAAFVMGKQVSVTIAGQNGPLQLNIMQPLISHEVLSSLDILARGTARFRTHCVEGIEVPETVPEKAVEKSLALVTPLVLHIGYDEAARIAHRASKEGKTLREVLLEEGILPPEEVEKLLDPRGMIWPKS
jgi:fumarate hydratase class II